ncbi:hypothetical protein MMC10_009750 [Thelotrema lepadinum]|nr:hypothetical protein [Thelotrema lepadinum]
MLNPRSIPSSGDSLGIFTIALDYTVILLATLALGLRLWSRRIKHVSLCFNDYVLFLAWLFTVGLIITATIGVAFGLVGPHVKDIPQVELLTQMQSLLQIYVAATLLWIASTTFVKLSILHLYLQLFKLPQFRKVVYAVGALTIAFFIGVVVIQFTICQPFAKNWDTTLPGTCGDSIASALANSLVDLCLDFIILFLPMPVLWQLHLPLRRKLMLSVAFGLGGIICIITILRAIASANFNESDITYEVAVLGIYAVLEPSLGIINACMPVMQPALRQLLRLPHPMPSPKSSKYHDLSSSGAGLQRLKSTCSRTNTTATVRSIEQEGAKTRRFHLEEDSFLFKREGNVGLETRVGASEGKHQSFGEIQPVVRLPEAAALQRATSIKVQWDWEISHERREGGGGVGQAL